MTRYAVVNPATGETLAEYPVTTDAELMSAMARAAAAHEGWSRASVGSRADLVRRVAELHRERRTELAAIATREMGKPLAQALGEVDFSADIYAYYADTADALSQDEQLTLLGGTGTAVVRRTSLGVLLGIMPWNYPFYQVARFAAPNLVVGNTVLLKHAPQCPESAAAIARLFADAGAPDGVYVDLYLDDEQVETAIADPRVRGISLTGSERAGSAVAELAGRHLKKIVLELGGSDPFILLSTEDLDRTVSAAVAARVENTGQACNAAKRFIVVDDLYEPFLQRFVAALREATASDPLSSDCVIGPLSSAAATARLTEQVDRAVAEGATLALDGVRTGNFFPATVLTDVSRNNSVYREELFGPVAVVHRVVDEEAAIAVANDTPFGLGSYVFTTDPVQAERVADRLEAGMVFVNLVGGDGVELPFGGVKRSGFGRELGRFGADEFVNKKLIRTA